MPELPEVETIRADLHSLVKGKRIVKFDIRKSKLLKSPRASFIRSVINSRVLAVRRRAKLLMFELDSNYTMLVHLKMTGQLVYRAPQGSLTVGGHPINHVSTVPNKYTHFTFSFSDRSKLYFNDVRQFGYIKLVSAEEKVKLLAKYGPEPLLKGFSARVLQERLSRRQNAKLKPLLLDQSVVAGLGNIYVDESLFKAGLRPVRKTKSLTHKEISKLASAIRFILSKAVRLRGTSFDSYVDGLGRQGTYWNKRLVYGRGGEKCRRCHGAISRTVVAGRGTYYCPKCQR